MALPLLTIPKRYKNGRPYYETFVDDIKNSVEEWALKIVRSMNQIAADTHGTNYPYNNTGTPIRDTALVDYLAALSEDETVTGNWTFSGSVTHIGAVSYTGSIAFTGSAVFDYDALKIWNPAGTFKYSINGGAIVADRTISLPVATASDTFALLGIAQTFTGSNIFSGGISIQKNSADAELTMYAAGAASYRGSINRYASRGSVATPTVSQLNDYCLHDKTYFYTGSAYREATKEYVYAESGNFTASLVVNRLFYMATGLSNEFIFGMYGSDYSIGIQADGRIYLDMDSTTGLSGTTYLTGNPTKVETYVNNTLASTLNSGGALLLADENPPTANYIGRCGPSKGWIDFSVTAATTVSSNTSYNCSSVTVSGWTQVLVVWNTDMSAADYSVNYNTNKSTVGIPMVNQGGSSTAAQAEVNVQTSAIAYRGYVSAHGRQ